MVKLQVRKWKKIFPSSLLALETPRRQFQNKHFLRDVLNWFKKCYCSAVLEVRTGIIIWHSAICSVEKIRQSGYFYLQLNSSLTNVSMCKLKNWCIKWDPWQANYMHMYSHSTIYPTYTSTLKIVLLLLQRSDTFCRVSRCVVSGHELQWIFYSHKCTVCK